MTFACNALLRADFFFSLHSCVWWEVLYAQTYRLFICLCKYGPHARCLRTLSFMIIYSNCSCHKYYTKLMSPLFTMEKLILVGLHEPIYPFIIISKDDIAIPACGLGLPTLWTYSTMKWIIHDPFTLFGHFLMTELTGEPLHHWSRPLFMDICF